jgi:hypothetical protein
MKTANTQTKNFKAMISVAIAIFGIVVMLLGFMGETGAKHAFSGSANYEYGGDAYTGIQNASAAAARNTATLGSSVASITEQAYILVGILLFLVGMYLFACAISSAPAPVAIAPEASAPAVADTDELPEL